MIKEFLELLTNRNFSRKFYIFHSKRVLPISPKIVLFKSSKTSVRLFLVGLCFTTGS